MTKLSVVIPTWNRKCLLERTLPTLFEQTLAPETYEIVIVVDPSEDQTVSWAKGVDARCSLRIIEQTENFGLSAARNRGVREAIGELILFMDDDILCEDSLLSSHVAAHEESMEAIVAFGPVRLSSKSAEDPTTAWARRGEEWITRVERDGMPRFPENACIDANNSVRRSTLLRVGLYDENLHVRENLDLGVRLWKAGIGFRFLPDALAYHLYYKSDRTLVERDARRYGREEAIICRRYPEYRSHSALGGLTRGGAPVRAIRQGLVRSTISAEPFLRMAYRSLTPVTDSRTARRMAVRLLEVRQGLQTYRSALEFYGSWSSMENEVGKQLPVLLYHHVGPNVLGEYSELTVSPGQFRREMEWLVRNGYTTITPEQWLGWLDLGHPLPPRPVMVTFDDAYADIADYALPVLAELSQTAVVFVITARIGSVTSWDAAPIMDLKSLRSWVGQGIVFGSHTRTHPDLRKLKAENLETEIVQSQSELEDALGVPVTTFAYPFGLFDDEARELVAAHYRLGFSTLEGMNGLHTDRYLLRRAMVHQGYSFGVMRARLFLGYNPVQRARIRIGLRTRIRRLARRAKEAFSWGR